MTRAEVEAMLQREKEKASLTAVCLNIRPPYPAKIVTKPYPLGYSVLKFQKFDGDRGKIREHVFLFLDSMGPFPYDCRYMPSGNFKVFN